MKSYAYVMLNGANGMVIRMHEGHRAPNDYPESLVTLLSSQYIPLREIVLPNGSVLLILHREDT